MKPVHRKTLVVDGLTPVGTYAHLRTLSPAGSFLLESVVPGERWGRYSIIGYRPRRQIVLMPDVAGEAFDALAALIPTGEHADLDVATRFARAHVGTVAYDIITHVTKVDTWPDSKAPLARFFTDATVIVFDNLEHTATIASTDLDAVVEAERDLGNVKALSPLATPDPTALPDDVTAEVSDEEYEGWVERCKEYILAGDAFQIVPARTFSTPDHGVDPFHVYRAMRVLSPAPYMYLLEFPEGEGAAAESLIGASPETLVKVENGTMYLRPIAGTRRRGRTPEEDLALEQEMLADPKEVAEHVMLIDLARNDIGRVAAPGSVTLTQRLKVERFSHVMHIVSEAQGKLPPERTPWDVLRASFPAGTLSGAPKVRAMQIIRELEPRPRYSYGGAVGYVTPGQDMDFAIAIRTVRWTPGRFEVSAGAGVVADSVPRLEAKETRNKARAALASIAAARLIGR